jgi:transcriptional regulator with XRE-family HTH domain
MEREHYRARLLRALSGMTQEQMADAIEVHRSLVAQIELGQVRPRPGTLERMAANDSLTVEDTDEILDLADLLRRKRQGHNRSATGVKDLETRLHEHVTWMERSLEQPADRTGSDSAEIRRRLRAWVNARLQEEAARAKARRNGAAAALLARVAEIPGR